LEVNLYLKKNLNWVILSAKWAKFTEPQKCLLEKNVKNFKFSQIFPNFSSLSKNQKIKKKIKKKSKNSQKNNKFPKNARSQFLIIYVVTHRWINILKVGSKSLSEEEELELGNIISEMGKVYGASKVSTRKNVKIFKKFKKFSRIFPKFSKNQKKDLKLNFFFKN
jgi:hypothetical protein